MLCTRPLSVGEFLATHLRSVARCSLHWDIAQDQGDFSLSLDLHSSTRNAPENQRGQDQPGVHSAKKETHFAQNTRTQHALGKESRGGRDEQNTAAKDRWWPHPTKEQQCGCVLCWC